MPCQFVVANLAPVQSDHSPVLLSFKSRQSQKDVGRTFRYLAAWETHDSWPEVVQLGWKKDGSFVNTINNFRSYVNSWNMSVFGNIMASKRRVLARIRGIQRALETHSTPNLRKLDHELRIELTNVLL